MNGCDVALSGISLARREDLKAHRIIVELLSVWMASRTDFEYAALSNLLCFEINVLVQRIVFIFGVAKAEDNQF